MRAKAVHSTRRPRRNQQGYACVTTNSLAYFLRALLVGEFLSGAVAVVLAGRIAVARTTGGDLGALLDALLDALLRGLVRQHGGWPEAQLRATNSRIRIGVRHTCRSHAKRSGSGSGWELAGECKAYQRGSERARESQPAGVHGRCNYPSTPNGASGALLPPRPTADM